MDVDHRCLTTARQQHRVKQLSLWENYIIHSHGDHHSTDIIENCVRQENSHFREDH